MSSETKKIRQEKIRTERLSWFFGALINENIERDGFIYFKHWDGNKGRWTVSQFTKQSWQNMKGSTYKHYKKEVGHLAMEEASKELELKYYD
jgi:hypothetical protein